MDKTECSCPSWLDGKARGEWQRVITLFLNVPGLLASVDRSVLASYCQSYARWCEARKRLEEEGQTVMITRQNGNSVAVESPWVNIKKTYCEAMMRYARELEFTPSAKTDTDFPPVVPAPTLQDVFNQAVKLLRDREEARAVKELLSSEEYVLEDQRGVLGLLASITWILKPDEMEILLDYCRTWNRYQEAQRTGKA